MKGIRIDTEDTDQYGERRSLPHMMSAGNTGRRPILSLTDSPHVRRSSIPLRQAARSAG